VTTVLLPPRYSRFCISREKSDSKISDKRPTNFQKKRAESHKCDTNSKPGYRSSL